MKKLFRKHAAVQAPVTIDPTCGDTRIGELRSLLSSGDWDAVAAMYDSVSGSDREWLLWGALADGGLEPVRTWPNEAPGSALALLVRGIQTTIDAWAVRGSMAASHVHPDAWKPFHDLLGRAEQDLLMSAQIHDDGVAWSAALAATNGLQRGAATLRERYRAAMAADPTLDAAADTMLQGTCEKWSGSHQEMFAFVRELTRDLPAGDSRHRLVGLAHIERGIRAADDDELMALRTDPVTQAEILESSAKAMAGVTDPAVGIDRKVLSSCALALGYHRLWDDARPLLDRLGFVLPDDTWRYFGDPAPLLHTYRRDAGLPAS